MLRNAVLPVHFPENRVIRFNVSSVTIEGWGGGVKSIWKKRVT